MMTVLLSAAKKEVPMDAERDAPVDLKLVKSESAMSAECDSTDPISDPADFQCLTENLGDFQVKIEPNNLESESSPPYDTMLFKEERISTFALDLISDEEINWSDKTKTEPQDVLGRHEGRFSNRPSRRDRPFPMALYARDVCTKSSVEMVDDEETDPDDDDVDTKTALRDPDNMYLSDESAKSRTGPQYGDVDLSTIQPGQKKEGTNIPSVHDPITDQRDINEPDSGINRGPFGICWEFSVAGMAGVTQIGPPAGMTPTGKHGEQIHYIPLAAVDLLRTEDGCLLKKIKLSSTFPHVADSSSIAGLIHPKGAEARSLPSMSRGYKPPFPLSVFDHLTYEGNSTTGDNKTMDPGEQGNERENQETSSSTTTTTATSSSKTSGSAKAKRMKSLPEELIFSCSICDYRAAQKGSLICHMRNHTGEKPYKCSYCDYSSVQKSNLNVHLRTHTEKPYKCSLCKFKSTTKDALDRHTRTHTGDKPYICSVCGYKSAQQSDLARHERKHTGDKPYICSVCGYKSAQQSSSVRHRRKHTGDKPYICSVCGFKSAQQSNLVIHKRKHTGERPFKCAICGYGSTVKSAMEDHLKTHTGEKPHSCDLCEYKSSTKSSLLKHMVKHTVYKQYLCDLCGYKSARKSSLQKHMIARHAAESA